MAVPSITPLPDAGLTLVFGLLELLEDRGGREDGYKIARDLNFKFGDLLKVMKAAEILGFAKDQRPFSPHLTLARFEPPRLPEKLRTAIQEIAPHEFGSLHTNQFHLIESKLKPSGAEYTTLESFSFSVAEA